MPTEKSEPQVNMRDFRWFIHGNPKTGKTSLSSFFPTPLFICTEEGLKGMSAYSVNVKSWRDFAEVVEAIRDESHIFDTVVIDEISGLYELLKDAVSEEHSVEHISDLKYGAGYDEANKRLYRALDTLYKETGVVLISHTREMKQSLGRRQVTKAIPDLSASPRKLLTGWVDIVIYLTIEERAKTQDGLSNKTDDDNENAPVETYRQHVAVCQPSPYVEAGGRLSCMPEKIDLGSSPKEGFDNLKQTFDSAAQELLEQLNPQN